jgi:hypothetical protein
MSGRAIKATSRIDQAVNSPPVRLLKATCDVVCSAYMIGRPILLVVPAFGSAPSPCSALWRSHLRDVLC